MLRPWKLEIRLDNKAKKAIYLQIADAIISDIRSGRLKSGDALPGSRNLAEMLEVNRNTVVEALNVLINEEWIVSKARKGTFVAEILPSVTGKPETGRENGLGEIQKNIYRISFDDGYPDSKVAPVAELARAYRQLFQRNARWKMMGYGSEFGDPEFISAIVTMLNQQRGMQVEQEGVCITRGSQMAMYLLAHCLFKNGDVVLVEEPGYKAAWSAFEHAGATLLPVSLDKDGLLISEVVSHLKNHRKIKAIYTTPHHQYPTTVTLSMQRRVELVQLSNKHGFTIIEDDYDNEFHYGYRPLLPLSSFVGVLNYVYVGTMSKVVAPALRIGYLASNDKNLVVKIGALRKIIDVQGDGIMEQAVLALINDGTIKRHIRKVTNHYKVKRDLVEQLLRRYLHNKVDYTVPDGGLAFWVVPKKTLDWPTISKSLSEKGIKILTPDHYSNNSTLNGMRLGFGSLSETELEEGIKTLSEMIKA